MFDSRGAFDDVAFVDDARGVGGEFRKRPES